MSNSYVLHNTVLGSTISENDLKIHALLIKNTIRDEAEARFVVETVLKMNSIKQNIQELDLSFGDGGALGTFFPSIMPCFISLADLALLQFVRVTITDCVVGTFLPNICNILHQLNDQYRSRTVDKMSDNCHIQKTLMQDNCKMENTNITIDNNLRNNDENIHDYVHDRFETEIIYDGTVDERDILQVYQASEDAFYGHFKCEWIDCKKNTICNVY